MLRPTLVLLHGFMGAGQDWQVMVELLEQKINCIVVDLPGHGRNQQDDFKPNSKNNWHGYVDCVRQLIQRKTQDNYFLMGYSMGGRIAMALAQQDPQSIQGLIIESAHPGLNQDHLKEKRLDQDMLWAHRFEGQPFTQVLNLWYQQQVFADLSDARRQELIKLRQHQSGPALGKVMKAITLAGQPDYQEFLRSFHKPVAYLSGQLDSKFQRIQSKLCQGESSVMEFSVPDCGHNCHQGNPEFTAKVIQQFIYKVNSES